MLIIVVFVLAAMVAVVGKTNDRYVARAVTGKGWRIFNRKTQKSWGNYFNEFPSKVLDELNRDKNPDVLKALGKLMRP